MPLISTSFPNLNGGVSQQPPSQRLENQCEAQENAIPQVIGGLTKRPPTEFVAELKKSGGAATKLSGDFIYFIQRDEDEKYILGIETDGSIYVWNLDGTHQLLYTPDGSGTLSYLSDAALQNPNETIRAVTIGDLTWIVNTTKKVQMKTTTSPASTATYEALLWIKNSGQGARFKVDVKVGGAATQTVEAEYRAPEIHLGQGTGQHTLDPSIPSTADFAELLTNTQSALPGYTVTGTPLNAMTNVTAQRVGSVIWISSSEPFQITVEDSFGQAAHNLIKGAATSFDDLPGIAKNGQIVLVEGNPEAEVDDYYVKFETNGGIDFGNGLWTETIAPGLKYEFDPDTMPHVLVRQPNGSWVVKPADGNAPAVGNDPAMGTRWQDYKFADRAAGSDLTNPLPSFVDSYISDITYFKGRLAITSGENVALSEAGEFFNFFRTTVTQLLDSAVIDVGVGGTAVNNLKRAVDFSDRLLLFSERAQFVLQGDPILTPLTATVTRATSFNAATSAAPAPAGSTLFFPFSRGQYSGVREFYKINENDLNFDAVESSLQVPKYIRGAIRKLTSSNHEDMLVVLAQPLSKLYCYKFFGGQQNRLQSAWFDMTIEEAEIVNAEFLQDSLFLVTQRGNRSYLERMDVQTGRVDPDSDYVTYLDYRTRINGNGIPQAVVGDELVSNGTFDTGIAGWTGSENTVSSLVLGKLRVLLDWQPTLLFQNNEVGAWYDPSDLATVFQDYLGSTPATVGDPVGLILDKSQGLALGSQQVVDGEFTDLANWPAEGTPTIREIDANGDLHISGAHNTGVTQQIPGLTTGWHEVTIEARAVTGGIKFQMNFSETIGPAIWGPTFSTVTYRVLLNQGRRDVKIACSGTAEFYVRSISIKPLAGNHASQSTSAARPVLQQSGGLYYLDFDGVDDGLTTAAVDLSGTNQLAVAAGVRDVAMTGSRGTVFNTNLGSLNGASLFVPSATLNNIQFSAFGDSGGGSMTLLETGLPNLLTAVLLANTDLSTTSNVLRRDGAVVDTGGAAGAGTYTNTPLYFGHRGGTSRFNGNLCACVVIDRTLTAAEISNLESYLSAKAGITLP